MAFIRHFLIAIQFFTRIPVTGRLAQWVGYSPEMLRASTAHFPGVGWLVGSLSAAVLAGLLTVLPDVPAAPWVAAVACTVFSVLLTGAFHEDGLADVADGLGGSYDRERALDIMKDSRIGSFGAIALVLGLFSKLALLALLVQQRSPANDREFLIVGRRDQFGIERLQLVAVRDAVASPGIPAESLIAMESSLSDVPPREQCEDCRRAERGDAGQHP